PPSSHMGIEGLVTQSVCQNLDCSGTRNSGKTGFCSITEVVGLGVINGRVDEDTGLYKVVRIINLRIQCSMSSSPVMVGGKP
ncbi:MAG TPA: hypothetical protein VFX10_06540, partial [Nitrospira sp.]|nr:hypothetical protein [Nitrospira sp.]